MKRLRTIFAFFATFALLQAQAAEITPEMVEKLGRNKGQTEFYNFEVSWGVPGAPPPPPPAPGSGRDGRSANEAVADRRDVQESDIFKIKPNSKTLFLLNNYRGLQIISFAKGAAQPEIVGRVEPTGNYPRDMYYDAGKQEILVLENINYSADGSYQYGKNESRILVYDVSNEKKPSIKKIETLKGDLADSRIVGDVLYIATSERQPWNGSNSASSSGNKGYVTSYNLHQHAIVEQVELSLPNSYGENMNIVEVENNGKFNYYLVAVLSDSQWSWWDRQSFIEVVDITNPRGQIKKMMMASAKGQIRERSNTQIKDGKLLVVSNYSIRNAEDRNIGRVAVETFSLPTGQEEIIDEKEAEYRRLHIERALKGLEGDARDKKLEELMKDPQLGLKGRLVQTEKGLKKLAADAVVTVGDTRGMSANLQDVRWTNDLLYVFWVPQDNIDPFDLFDISDLSEGPKYLKRLEFDGWIERSIPFTYKDRSLVLGLGYVIPNVDNENGRRHPQAKLFEIMKRGEQTHILEIETMTLDKGNTWVNFNAPDKFIEVQFGADGKGSVLFSASNYEANRYTSGAKLLGFDLEAAVTGRGQVFTDGAFLTGEASWLRRVFRNPEIEMINTFSDEELGTFDVAQGVGRADQVEKAVSLLELARNIAGYTTISGQGVQIVSKGSLWASADTARVELRLVDPASADTEKPLVKSTLVIPGAYQSTLQLKSQPDTLLVVSQTRFHLDNDTDDYKKTRIRFHISKVIMGAAGLEVVAKGEKVVNPYDRESSMDVRVGHGHWGYGQLSLVEMRNGKVLVAYGSDLSQMNVRNGRMTLSAITTKNCELPSHYGRSLVILNGKLMMKSTEKVAVLGSEEPVKTSDEDPEYKQIFTVVKHHLTPLSMRGATATCKQPVNVPGTLLAVYDNHLVVDDHATLDIIKVEGEDGVEYKTEQEQLLLSLSMGEQAATLVDIYEPKNGSLGSMKELANKKFIFFESEEVNQWTPVTRFHKYITVSFDSGLHFTETTRLVELELPGVANISGLIQTESQDVLALVTSGRKVQILKIKAESDRPEVQTLLVKGKRAKSYVIPTHSYYGSNHMNFHYTPSNSSVELAAGLTGVVQLKLAN